MRGTDSSSQDKVRTVEEIFRRSGLKLTHQRLEILHVLASAKDHPSAEDVYKRVKPKIPPISFDTVYRTLALFERYGVIARVQHFDDRTRYDPNTTPHPHMVCVNCKKIDDFYWPGLGDMDIPEGTKGWGLIRSTHVELRGTCRECLEREKKEAGS